MLKVYPFVKTANKLPEIRPSAFPDLYKSQANLNTRKVAARNFFIDCCPLAKAFPKEQVGRRQGSRLARPRRSCSRPESAVIVALSSHMVRLFKLSTAAVVAASLLPAPAASAHPHVWVAVRSEVVFSPDGKVTGVRHAWEFDEMYSAFAVQGLGKDGKPPTKEELAPLAKTNVESLAEFDYFTFGKQNSTKLAFTAPENVTLEADDRKIVTLRFFLPLATPIPAKRPFSFQVYDPTYFVSFGFEKKDPVTLARAPAGCSVSLVDPAPLAAADTQKLSEAFFQNMSPSMDVGVKLATRAIVACP